MAEEGPHSLLLADELALVCDGIRSVCEATGEFRVVAQAANGSQAWALLRETSPELALLDLDLTGLHALEIVRRVDDSRLPTLAGVVTHRRDRKTILEILRARAMGVFLKTDPAGALIDGLRRMAAGSVFLSPGVDAPGLFQSEGPRSAKQPLDTLSAREHQVFTLMVQGVRAKEIAARLGLSPKTVDTYRASLMRKLDIYDVAGLVKFAMLHRLTD